MISQTTTPKLSASFLSPPSSLSSSLIEDIVWEQVNEILNLLLLPTVLNHLVIDYAKPVPFWDQKTLQRCTSTLRSIEPQLKSYLSTFRCFSGIHSGELISIFESEHFFYLLSQYATTSDRTKMEEIKNELFTFFDSLDEAIGRVNLFNVKELYRYRLTVDVTIAIIYCQWLNTFPEKLPQNFIWELKQQADKFKKTFARHDMFGHSDCDFVESWEYYDDSKYLINEKRWIEAKAHLLHYRNSIIASNRQIKIPSKDNHLKYLSYVQDILNKQSHQIDNLLYRIPAPTNPYTALWEEWKKQHGNS